VSCGKFYEELLRKPMNGRGIKENDGGVDFNYDIL
jgi:hypothetical protein